MSNYLTKYLPNPIIANSDVSGWIYDDTMQNSFVFAAVVGGPAGPDFHWEGHIESEINPTPCFKMLEGYWGAYYAENTIGVNIMNPYNILTTPDYHYKISFNYKSDNDYQIYLDFTGDDMAGPGQQDGSEFIEVCEDLPAKTSWTPFEYDLTAKIIDLSINMSNPIKSAVGFCFLPLIRWEASTHQIDVSAYYEPLYIKDINYTYLNPFDMPNTPTNLTGFFDDSAMEITLSFSPNDSSVIGFKVFRSVDGSNYSLFEKVNNYSVLPTPTTYINNYLDSEILVWWYKIVTFNPAGLESSFSNYISIAIPFLNAPTNLIATVVSSSKIDLNWSDNSDYESLFRIYRSLYNNTSWTEIATTTTNVCNYSDNDTNPSILYFYKVCAYNSKGNSSDSNIVSARPTSIPLNINNIPDFVNAETRAGVTDSEIRFINSGAYLESNTPAIVISNDSYEGTNSLKYVKTSNITHIEINIPLNDILDWSVDKYWIKFYIKSDSLPWIRITSQTSYGSYNDLMCLGGSYWWGNAINLHTLYSISSYFVGKTLTSIKIVADGSYIIIDDIQVGEKPSLIVRKPFFFTMTQHASCGIECAMISESFMNNTVILEKSTDNVNWNHLSDLTPSYPNDQRGEYYLYNDWSVLPLTTYYYRIKATDTYSTSLYSDLREFTTSSIPCIPSSPTNFVASYIGTNQINLSWVDNSVTETNYKVIRYIDPTYDPPIWEQILPANSTTFNVTGLTANTIYYFGLDCYNSTGHTVVGILRIVVQTAGVVPNAPTNLIATDIGSTSILLQWNTNTEWCKLYKSTDGANYSLISNNGTNWAFDNSVIPSTSYWYKVFAHNLAGDSNPSNILNVTTLSTIPTITIGSQVWMKYNVDTNVVGTVYNNDEANRALYGGLYTYTELSTAVAQYPGFHLPSETEYKTLKTTVSNSANSLKEIGTTYWNTVNGTNTSGWGGRGGGGNWGGFGGLKSYGLWWTSTDATGNTELLYLDNTNTIYFSWQVRTNYFSLRLIKD